MEGLPGEGSFFSGAQGPAAWGALVRKPLLEVRSFDFRRNLKGSDHSAPRAGRKGAGVASGGAAAATRRGVPGPDRQGIARQLGRPRKGQAPDDRKRA